MSDKKKSDTSEEKKVVVEELDLEDLEGVSGGSIRNVNFTKTVDISKDTRSKI